MAAATASWRPVWVKTRIRRKAGGPSQDREAQNDRGVRPRLMHVTSKNSQR